MQSNYSEDADFSNFSYSQFGSYETNMDLAFHYTKDGKSYLIGRRNGQQFDAFHIEWEGDKNFEVGKKYIAPGKFKFKNGIDFNYENTETIELNLNVSEKGKRRISFISGQFIGVGLYDKNSTNKLFLDIGFNNIKLAKKYIEIEP